MYTRFAALLLTAVCCFSLQAKSNYYDLKTERELTNGTLRDQSLLSYIGRAASKNFRPLGYKKRAKTEIFGYVDIERDNSGYYVRDVYCGFIVRKKGRDTRPANGVMNVEHTWPQSKGAKREPARGDIHHLFPTDSRANSARGNYPFGEVSGGDATDKCSLSKSGKIVDPETGRVTGQRGFEVPNDHKGNTARAMFYVSAKYGYKLSRLEEFYLRKWHREDPVDRNEIDRNDRIQEAQGNRNPFVDFPDLVDRIEDL